MSSAQFYRKWHRWIGFPASFFLLFVAVTGIMVAFTEFFGEEEQLREATRDLVSPVSTQSPASAWADPLARALATVAQRTNGAPVDKIEMQFKGDRPTIAIFTGKPSGGEDRKFVVHMNTGAVLSEEAYADKPFLYRLHSGEAFGDGGLVVAMFWGLALALIAASGLVIYVRVLRLPHRHATGIRKVFW
jgi:uncharacterized iron-regulated membrane protein